MVTIMKLISPGPTSFTQLLLWRTHTQISTQKHTIVRRRKAPSHPPTLALVVRLLGRLLFDWNQMCQKLKDQTHLKLYERREKWWGGGSSQLDVRREQMMWFSAHTKWKDFTLNVKEVITNVVGHRYKDRPAVTNQIQPPTSVFTFHVGGSELFGADTSGPGTQIKWNKNLFFPQHGYFGNLDYPNILQVMY